MILRCTACHATCSPHQVQTFCPRCRQPLAAEYSLHPDRFTPDDLDDHPTLWRYAPFLPSIPSQARISIGEGNTPLLERDYKNITVLLKDETTNPTGTILDRGLCVALSMARTLWIASVAIASTGHGAVSAAIYALSGQLHCKTYLPMNTPELFAAEILDAGSEMISTGSDVHETAAKLISELGPERLDVSAWQEPYRIEGLKTLGLEIAEQLGLSSGKMDWEFPDVVVCPVGHGTILIGIWKAFQEIRRLDWIRKPLPKMVATQAEGCAPIVTAFNKGRTVSVPWQHPDTDVPGLKVPKPTGGPWVLSILRETGGRALAVRDAELPAARQRLAAISNTHPGLEAAAAWRGLEILLEEGWIKPGERAVVIITGDDRRER